MIVIYAHIKVNIKGHWVIMLKMFIRNEINDTCCVLDPTGQTSLLVHKRWKMYCINPLSDGIQIWAVLMGKWSYLVMWGVKMGVLEYAQFIQTIFSWLTCIFQMYRFYVSCEITFSVCLMLTNIAIVRYTFMYRLHMLWETTNTFIFRVNYIDTFLLYVVT